MVTRPYLHRQIDRYCQIFSRRMDGKDHPRIKVTALLEPRHVVIEHALRGDTLNLHECYLFRGEVFNFEVNAFSAFFPKVEIRAHPVRTKIRSISCSKSFGESRLTMFSTARS